ncbi:hypothetical protein CPB86DRAFT_772445 [Serendipita vermifera]|nr:hypothetical protein CPB86DRAFT_772445 [Serendipita vermifera]
MSSINSTVRRPKARNPASSNQTFDGRSLGRIPSARQPENSGAQSYYSFTKTNDMQGGGTTPRIHSDYPTRQHYPEFISLFETATLQLLWALAGLRDAFRWDRVVTLLVTDQEIRAHMIKSFVLNALALASVYIFDLILMPVLHRKASPSSIVSTSSVYQILWVLPVVGGSLYLNGIWCATIAEKVYTLQHGRRHAAVPTSYTGLITSIASSAYRVILITTSVLLSFALSYIPWIGKICSFLFVCWVDSFVWQASGLSLAARVKQLEERWAYFLGFGLPTTALCMSSNSLANTALFALIFPSYIILATYAQPTPLHPYSPVPPVQSRTTGETVYPLPSPFIPVRLPVFQLVIWINSWLIRGIDRLTRGRKSVDHLSTTNKRWDGEEESTESGIPLRASEVPRRAPGVSGLTNRTRID